MASAAIIAGTESAAGEALQRLPATVARLREAVDVSLAVSLHAPNDALRDELVPLNRSHPLDELMAADDRDPEDLIDIAVSLSIAPGPAGRTMPRPRGTSRWRAARLAGAELEPSGLTVRVVQADIDQREKRYANREAILDHYLRLSSAPGLEDVDVLVWPEGAVPGFLLNDPPLLARIRDRLPQGLLLLTGVVRVEFDDGGAVSDYYNALAALRLGEEVTLDATYDKARLVPFGEVNPLSSVTRLAGFDTLAAWSTGYSAGPGGRTLDVEGVARFAPLICYEVVYPRHAPGGADRPTWLLNISNDSWYGNSAGPRQHANQARYRALEAGLPMARAASNGVSGLTGPYGRPLRVLGIEDDAAIDLALPKPLNETMYARHGEGPWMIAFILVLIATGRLSSLERQGRAPNQDAARLDHRL